MSRRPLFPALLIALLFQASPALAQSASGSNTAVGVGSSANGASGNTAVGQGAIANCSTIDSTTGLPVGNCTSIGAGATSNGLDATAIGVSAAAGQGAVAMGFGANASFAIDGVAVGTQSSTATDGVALGFQASSGQNATAVGSNSQATLFGTAVGTGSVATSPGVNPATAVGQAATAQGDGSLAVGAIANVAATASFGTAIGQGATTTAQNAVSLGSASLADQPDTVSFGNARLQRRLVNLAPGIDGTDGMNVSQLMPFATAFGGGSTFTNGVFTPPSYDLSGNIFNNVGSALLYLNGKIGTGSGIPGPPGPQGPVGPQGPAGTGSGGVGCTSGAVCYDNTSKSSITLQGATGTQIHNVANGTQANDAVNLSQLQQSESIQNDVFNTQLTTLGNQVNTEIQNLSHRVDSVGAMSTALTMMAGASNPDPGKVSAQAGIGMLNGQAAVAIGLRATISPRVGVLFGVSHSQNQTMGGFGISVNLDR